MIQLEGVSKTFRPGPLAGRGVPVVEALAAVSVRIPRGEAWGVVGPNGAGKSTLFALLLGFLHPSAGSVAIDGLEPRAYVRRHGAAYLPERFRLPAEWNVRSALRALAGLERVPAAVATARTDAVVEQFGLAPHAGKAVGTLSHGLLQRLGLAQAWLAERELVVLDEPTEGLDPLWRIRFRSMVGELKAAGRTVLIASHDLAEVERLADRALVLQAGRVREVLDLARQAPATSYRLELAARLPTLGDVFPDAVAAEHDRPVFLVRAADPAELSRRLAALIDTGGVLVSVTPAAPALEERVQRALSDDE